MSNKRPVSLIVAILPLLFLIIFLSANVIIFDDTLGGANQIILLLAGAFTSVLAVMNGVKWDTILEAIVKNIGKALPAILILLLIGALAGTWLISGVVPAMIYYGLKIIHPKIFLLAAIVVCGLVSLATGSSWSTIATVGVALLGIGKALGFHEGLVAGAIISGAYFGDKMSPLSDTTNLASAITGTDLFTHVRYMMITTVPSLSIAILLFTGIGIFYDLGDTSTNVQDTLAAIKDLFYISPVLLLVPALLILVIIKKMPPVPALLFGTLIGGIFALIFQPDIVRGVSELEGNYALQSYKSFMQAMFGDVNIHSENSIVNELFHTSGMAGMLNTVWLILAAMTFGGSMEAAGFLERVTRAIMSKVHSTGSLILSTISTSIFFNLTASDQYIAIVVPGHMYGPSYRDQGLKSEVLSRTLEDGGTLTSVLIPWNTGGATQAKVLGVPTLTYLPYCFFNLVNPVVAVTIGYLGYKIRRINAPDKSRESEDIGNE
jgi:Na+:H+ antiporter, NhaC family